MHHFPNVFLSFPSANNFALFRHHRFCDSAVQNSIICLINDFPLILCNAVGHRRYANETVDVFKMRFITYICNKTREACPNPFLATKPSLLLASGRNVLHNSALLVLHVRVCQQSCMRTCVTECQSLLHKEWQAVEKRVLRNCFCCCCCWCRCSCFYSCCCCFSLFCCWSRGGVVVKALRYKPEGRGFDFRRRLLEFFIVIILPAALWHWG